MDIDKLPKQESIKDEINIVQIFDLEKEEKAHVDFYPTKFMEFDKVIENGFTEGDLIIVSAPTAQGKTSFCQTLTHHFVRQAFPCLWFSYEITNRALCKKFRNLKLDEKDLLYAPKKLERSSIDWIEEQIKIAYNLYDTRLVFIDHLGILAPKIQSETVLQNENMAYRLTSICRQLKGIAIELEISIILIAHLRKTERPNINDLSGSIGIAQEADLVFLLERQKQKGTGSEDRVYTNKTKITLAKNRRTGISKIIYCEMRDDMFIQVEKS